MKELRIKDICDKGSSNLKQKDVEGKTGQYPVYGASGVISYIDSYHQEEDYIAIVKDGSGIGRVTFMPAKSSIIGTMQYILPKEGFNINYIGYCLQSLDLSKYKQGAAIPHIYFRDYGERFVKVTEDLNEQQSIVDYLDSAFAKIDAMKANAEKALNEAKALFQASLKKMLEPKAGWEEKKLEDMGDLKNGMNFGRKESGYNIHILGVGDFGKLFQINNTDLLQIISLNDVPSSDYLLQNNDIVFVRSNGNKNLVGRSVLIKTGKQPCSFSGFCIRFRMRTNEIDARFLTHYMKKEESRKKLVGNGANISNLNQKVLNQFRVSFPQLNVQQSIVTSLDSLKSKVDRLQDNFDKISQECDALKQAILRQVFE